MVNWIFNKRIDLPGLFLPVWLVLIGVFFLPDSFVHSDFPLWMWVAIVLAIDVSHVWSTIFRTYLDKEERNNHRLLLSATPILAFSVLFVLAFMSTFWFWRILAYLALFHFIKQQYGFMMLYKVKAKDFASRKWLTDRQVIYMAMIYPVLFWHLTPDRAFSWFVDGDFFAGYRLLFIPQNIWLVFHIIYTSIILTWLIIEIKRKNKSWGKILWVMTTALNWFIGIVYFNSDVVFTITNVVAHGIPYVILIVQYEHQKSVIREKQKKIFFIAFYVVAGVLLLGTIEEYFWDIFLYGEHRSFYESFTPYFDFFVEHPAAVALALALLSLPQVTHYILDGFIWKNNDQNPYVKLIFKPK